MVVGRKSNGAGSRKGKKETKPKVEVRTMHGGREAVTGLVAVEEEGVCMPNWWGKGEACRNAYAMGTKMNSDSCFF